MAGASWNAKGLLKPLWEQVPGKRDALAQASGVRGTELSSHNTGKPLGPAVAQRIIDGFAELGVTVSLAELGAPLEAAADAESVTLRSRLDELATTLGDSLEKQAKMDRQIARLQARVRALEAGSAGGEASARGSQ